MAILAVCIGDDDLQKHILECLLDIDNLLEKGIWDTGEGVPAA